MALTKEIDAAAYSVFMGIADKANLPLYDLNILGLASWVNLTDDSKVVVGEECLVLTGAVAKAKIAWVLPTGKASSYVSMCQSLLDRKYRISGVSSAYSKFLRYKRITSEGQDLVMPHTVLFSPKAKDRYYLRKCEAVVTSKEVTARDLDQCMALWLSWKKEAIARGNKVYDASHKEWIIRNWVALQSTHPQQRLRATIFYHENNPVGMAFATQLSTATWACHIRLALRSNLSELNRLDRYMWMHMGQHYNDLLFENDGLAGNVDDPLHAHKVNQGSVQSKYETLTVYPNGLLQQRRTNRVDSASQSRRD